MVPEELIDKYTWVDEIEGWTVAAIRGRTLDEVVRIYGGDLAAPMGEFAFADLDEQRSPRTDDLELFVQVLRHGEYVVTLEQHGWSGALPEIARRCSSGGGAPIGRSGRRPRSTRPGCAPCCPPTASPNRTGSTETCLAPTRRDRYGPCGGRHARCGQSARSGKQTNGPV